MAPRTTNFRWQIHKVFLLKKANFVLCRISWFKFACVRVCEDVYLLSVSVVFVQGCSQLFSWKLVSELQPSSQQRNILIMWDVNFITGTVKIMSDTKMILAVTNVFSHASFCHQQTLVTHITSSKYCSPFSAPPTLQADTSCLAAVYWLLIGHLVDLSFSVISLLLTKLAILAVWG